MHKSVKRWLRAVDECVELGDEIDPPPPVPIEELAIDIRHGLELEESPALALLDEIQRFRRQRLAPLKRGAEACSRLRSILDAACVSPSAADPGLAFELRATLKPLEDEILALGALQRGVAIHRGAHGVIITTPPGADAPFAHTQVRAIREALRLSGAPAGFAFVVLPAGYEVSVKAEAMRVKDGRLELPDGNSVRLTEPLPPPEAFSEEVGDSDI